MNEAVRHFTSENIKFPPRKKNTHKGHYGKLAIIAGSSGLTGAAILACRAALACGAGLITLYHPPGLETIFETTLIEVMTRTFVPDDVDCLSDILNSDGILIGPGIGKSRWAMDTMTAIVESEYQKNIIYDADALNLLAENTHLLKKIQNAILTPHIGEFARLTGKSITEIETQPVEILKEYCLKYRVNVLLKNHFCLYSDGYTTYLIEGGNDGLATGGTGDVLAGMILSFVTQTASITGHSELEQTIPSAVKYLYTIAETIETKYYTHAITPTKIIEHLFRKTTHPPH